MNSDVLTAEGGVRTTALHIFKTQIVSLDLPVVKDLARQLKRGNRYDDTQAVYAWVKSNIRYQRDPDGVEVIRRADATVSERKGDCEDMTILINAILYNMGYQKNEIKSNIIAQDSEYCHIFPSLGSDNRKDSGVIKGIAMDCVPEISVHNEIASPITKAKVFTLQEQEIMANANTEPILGAKGKIAGIGSATAATDLTKELQKKQSDILMRAKGGVLGPEDRRSLRKLHTLIRMNGLPEQKYMAQLLPFMEDVTPSGNIVWRDGTEQDVAVFLNAADLEMQTGVNLTDDNDGIEGIGAVLPKLKAKVKAAVQTKTQPKPKAANQVPPKKATPPPRPAAPKVKVGAKEPKKSVVAKVKEAAKNALNKVKAEIKTAVQHPGHTLVRFQPATIAIRNGALLGFKVNIFHLPSKLMVGYFTEAEAKAKGLDMAEWKKAVAATKQAEDAYFAIGGERDKFKDHVKKGYEFGLKRGKGIKGAEIGEIGEAVTGAAIVTLATTFFGTVGTFLKGINFKKMQQNAKEKNPDVEADFGDNFAEGDTRNFMEMAAGMVNLADESLYPQTNGFQNEAEMEVAGQNLGDYSEGNNAGSGNEGSSSSGNSNEGGNNNAEKPRLLGADSWTPWLLGGGAILAGFLFFNSK